MEFSTLYNKIEERSSFGLFQWFIIILCASIILIAINDMCWDFCGRQDLMITNCFLYQNVIELVPQKSSTGALSCLNGIRIFSMMAIITFHTAKTLFAFNSAAEFMYLEATLLRTFIHHLELFVDNFFVIGGLLVAYNFMKDRHNGKKFNYFRFILHRYARLIPVYGILVLGTIAFGEYMSTGRKPNNAFNIAVGRCERYWWSGLLLIQNYVNPQNLCLGPSWYISADIHLYILSPIILLPLRKFGKKVLAIPVALSLASIGYIFIFCYRSNFDFNTISVHGHDFGTSIYYPTHVRATSWLIGMVLGYILYNTKDSNIQIGLCVRSFLWIATIAFLALIFYIPYTQYRDQTHNVIGFALYQALHRPMWSFAVSWIIFAFVQGYCKSFSWVLSFPVLEIFAKYSYAIYLIHGLVILKKSALQRSVAYFNEYLMVLEFLSVTSYSFLLAIPVVLLIELPAVKLEQKAYQVFNASKLLQYFVKCKKILVNKSL